MTSAVDEHLAASLDSLRARLRQPENAAAHDALAAQLAEIANEAPLPLPLDTLRQTFELDPVAMDTLLLVAVPELDAALADELGLPAAGFATPALVTTLLGLRGPLAMSRVSRNLGPGGALRTSGLVREVPFPDPVPWSHQPLRLAPHWLAFLQGRRVLGSRHEHVARRLVPAVSFEQIACDTAARRDFAWAAGRAMKTPPPTEPLVRPETLDYPLGAALLLVGPTGSGRTLLAKALATEQKRPVIEVDGGALGLRDDAAAVLVDLCEQAHFFAELLIVRGAEQLTHHAPAATFALAREVRRRPMTVVIICEDTRPLRQPLERVILYCHVVDPSDARMRRAVWELNAPEGMLLDPAMDFAQLAKHPLNGHGVQQALALAMRLAGNDGGGPTPVTQDMLETAAGRLSWPTPITSTDERSPGLAIHDLVLHDAARSQVEELVAAVSVRDQVLGEWGFGRKIHRGTGLICLFNGEPGTGKTLTAEVVAEACGRRLKRVDTGRIVDKYIGETQKNLARLFEETLPERDLLLFDEADALFGQRTEVSRAVDRYANMEINALLQLVERHQGVVLLTTNLQERMDSAFERRFTYRIRFELPSPPMRARLWRLLLPESAPIADDVDLETLSASFELSGGSIKNAVLRAAYRAASSERAICQRALVAAARYEAIAAGRLVREDRKLDAD